jgi:hypothetical protein
MRDTIAAQRLLIEQWSEIISRFRNDPKVPIDINQEIAYYLKLHRRNRSLGASFLKVHGINSHPYHGKHTVEKDAEDGTSQPATSPSTASSERIEDTDLLQQHEAFLNAYDNKLKREPIIDVSRGATPSERPPTRMRSRPESITVQQPTTVLQTIKTRKKTPPPMATILRAKKVTLGEVIRNESTIKVEVDRILCEMISEQKGKEHRL